MRRAFLAIQDPNLASAVRHLLTSLTLEVVGSVATWDDALEQLARCEFDVLCIEQLMIVRGDSTALSALGVVRAHHVAIVCIEAPRTYRQGMQDVYTDLMIRTSDRPDVIVRNLKVLIEAHTHQPASLQI